LAASSLIVVGEPMKNHTRFAGAPWDGSEYLVSSWLCIYVSYLSTLARKYADSSSPSRSVLRYSLNVSDGVARQILVRRDRQISHHRSANAKRKSGAMDHKANPPLNLL
jgi:hypothetical protein